MLRLLPLLLGLLATSAQAQPAATLSMAVGVSITTADPHFLDSAPNKGFASNIFEALLDMDPASKPHALLAESWRAVDATTWEFTLRPDVRFHDGHVLTGDDIAFTLDRVGRVPGTPVPFTTYTRSIARVELAGPRTVRLHTKTPEPLLPVYLTQVKVIGSGGGNAPTAEDFNRGTAAIGTGPYRLAEFRSGDRAELARFDGYWGTKPAWEHVAVRFIPNNTARVAALLAGDVQLIDTVPTTDIPRLRGTKGLHLAETGSLRLIYLMMDQDRAATPYVQGPDGAALERNPLQDVRVRRALSLAINRQGIVDRVMEGAAIPSGQFLPPGSTSYVPRLVPPPFEPDAARKLLAEAGYPKGLRLTLHGPSGRYVDDSAILQAIGQMWQRVGVDTRVDVQPWNAYTKRIAQRDFSVAMLGVGSATGDSSVALRVAAASYDPPAGLGSLNGGRYSNPELDAVLKQAMGTGDDAARERLLQRATELAFDDVAIIPLHVQKNVWAMRDTLRMEARRDEQTRAADVQPAP